MMKEKHTFVICAYKESAYLEECVKSLKEQKKESNIIMVTSTPNNYIKNISNFISNTFDKEKTYSDINDIMELYNVIKYIDDKSIPFSSDIKNSLSDFKQIANKKIAMFFNKILTNDNFHENYSKLDVFYHNDFWEILDITPYINSSNTNAISTLILSNDNLFSKILSKPNLVKKFDKVLTKKC